MPSTEGTAKSISVRERFGSRASGSEGTVALGGQIVERRQRHHGGGVLMLVLSIALHSEDGVAALFEGKVARLVRLEDLAELSGRYCPSKRSGNAVEGWPRAAAFCAVAHCFTAGSSKSSSQR